MGTPAQGALTLRLATPEDLAALIALESSFPGDRLGRGNFRHLLNRANADVLVAELGGEVVGSAVILYRRGFRSARLYSLVVAPQARGLGVARALLAQAEQRARARACALMRLEVREDNAPALRLYLSHGYEVVGRSDDYYEDHGAALRLRKWLEPTEARLLEIPYYPQTLPFTCGPAALMMAMRALGGASALTEALELELWREATTIFMLSGHGGCSAEGLAVAALRRGFCAEVWTRDDAVPFIDSVRLPYKKRVITLTHEQFRAELAERGAPILQRPFGVREVIAALESGAVPLLLISTFRLDGKKEPHWVVVSGYDARNLYLHDPYVPKGYTRGDGVHLPLERELFGRVSRFGKARHRYVLVLRRPKAQQRALEKPA